MPVNGGAPRRLTSFGSHPDVAPDGETIVFQSEAAAVLSSGALPALPPSTIWLVDIASGAIRPLTRPGQPAGGHGSPSFSPDGRWIAFTTSDQSRSEVWVVAADGGEPHPLVQGPSLAFHPRWCPGSKALYYCAVTPDGRSGLWRVPLTRRGRWPAPGPPEQVVSLTVAAVRQFDLSDDGERLVHTAFATASNLWSLDVDPSTGAPDGDPRPMTTGSGRNSRPLFSPDGALLAFERSQVGLQRDIWCLDMASGRLQQITSWKGGDTQASWSGSDTIVYLSDRDDEWALWATDLATRTTRRLLALPASVTWVRASPDGRTIAYHQQDPGGAVNLWRRDVDGSPPRQLTFGSGRMAFPSWSPNGALLAFESRRGDDDVIYTLPSTGGEPEIVVDEPGLSWPNDWSPDGRRILFVALRDGLWNVWWVDRLTGRQLQLTHDSLRNGYLRYPAWSPRGDLVVYEVAETIGDLWLTQTIPSR
jgi:Tol biopolymer transport system component